MAITIEGRNFVPASPARVWECLNDANILKACIPGCESLEKLDDATFTGVVLFKVGPVKARFRGRVTLTDQQPPSRCRVLAEGEGGIAGFGKGLADVFLTETAEGTELVYKVDASIGGKIAQFGARLMVGTIRNLADEFFTTFASQVVMDAGA